MADAANHDSLELLEMMHRFREAGRPSDVIDKMPTDEAVLREVAQALDTIGIEAYNSSDLERAHDAFYLLFMCRLRIVERYPGSRNDIRDFASAEDLLGAVMMDLGNIQAAEKLVSESLRYRQGLHRDDPNDAHASYLFGQSLWRMAALSLAKNDFGGEADLVRQASAHLAEVNATWPGSRFIESLLHEVDDRLATIKRQSLSET